MALRPAAQEKQLLGAAFSLARHQSACAFQTTLSVLAESHWKARAFVQP